MTNKNQLAKYFSYFFIAYFILQVLIFFMPFLTSTGNTSSGGLSAGDGIILLIIAMTSLPVYFLIVTFITPVLILISGAMLLKSFDNGRLLTLVAFSIDLICRVILLPVYFIENAYYFQSVIERSFLYSLAFNISLIVADLAIIILFVLFRGDKYQKI